ncbi:hypothetical protein CSA56_13930 [candidate division KSB3 bacterium]|uniref:TonB C-terminal domain-containing protein n=1 Tax=candidate division KSB3 bacterium TaxID=2044937 RepID=A0A2G6KB49_9BACT|nr:MAG: hypothetical protein CSA56_13930 [candidate division KSB3 bacterium]
MRHCTSMKNLLSCLEFRAKTNKKKTPGFLFISSNSTLYITFILSIVFHLGLIYTIPAVNVFSEGEGELLQEPIVIDFVQEDFSELSFDVSSPALNQFQANTPDSSTDYGEKLLPQRLEVDENINFEIAPPEKITSLESEHVLLDRVVTKDPDMTSLLTQKRTVQSTPSRIPEAEILRSGKVDIDRKQPEVPLLQPSRIIEQPARIEPLHHRKSAPAQKKEEPALQFPTSLQKKKERQMIASDRLMKRPLELEKRSLSDTKTTEPTLVSQVKPSSPLSQKRRFGMTRENETDTNRFGIFAGKRFENPTRKEDIQKSPVQQDERQSPADADATEAAKSLHTSSQIEGPVKGRALIYRPNPPQLDNVNIDVELKLKFWVLPDGTIGEVIPIKRGNAELERIAINYLKKWKFEALPEGREHQQIWGTIPIKFTIQ